jgi:hypothetical protein
MAGRPAFSLFFVKAAPGRCPGEVKGAGSLASANLARRTADERPSPEPRRERWLNEHPGAKLPIVLPVLLNQAEGGWKAAPELAGMLDASPELLEATRRFVPHFA